MNQNSIDASILQQSRNMLKEFSLCDSCLGRFYVKKLHLSSSKLLGKKIKSQINYKKNEKCFVCKDLLNNLHYYVDELLSISQNTHYSTFLIGTILKPSFLDRDDLLRSKFKTRGIDSIKSEITKSLTNLFSKKSKKLIHHNNPDLTFLVNFRTNLCEQRAKSLIISGRYVKNKRGLPQKQKSCSDCSGKGCIFCNNRGITEFNSVEGILAQFFYKQFDCTQVKLTWIGGEDKNSLVHGHGRLFFAKLINPKKRNSRLKKQINFDSIFLSNLNKVKQIPIDPIKFQSQITLQVRSNSKISTPLSKLKKLTQKPILISDGSKIIERRIHEINYKKDSSESFSFTIVADGGISMKKLVEGDGIEPNVSEILGVDCTCVQFDFENIEINDNN